MEVAILCLGYVAQTKDGHLQIISIFWRRIIVPINYSQHNMNMKLNNCSYLFGISERKCQRKNACMRSVYVLNIASINQSLLFNPNVITMTMTILTWFFQMPTPLLTYLPPSQKHPN